MWKMHKKLVLAGLALMLGAMVFLVGCQAPSNVMGNSNQQTGIYVSGEGKVTVTPDVATIQLGVQAQAATVTAAQAQAAEAMNSLIAALKANGVADKDIKTVYFSVQQVTKWDPATQQQINDGYMVVNTVSAKVRDVTKAGTVLDSAVAAGGDYVRVNSITFSVDDPILKYDEAREKAVADAKDKAKSLAELAGVTLGSVIYITESINSPGFPPIYRLGEKAAADATTSISPGETDIIINVQMVYAIR
jgi:uncharacterized protein YggE